MMNYAKKLLLLLIVPCAIPSQAAGKAGEVERKRRAITRDEYRVFSGRKLRRKVYGGQS
jgi:hypothetical protein